MLGRWRARIESLQVSGLWKVLLLGLVLRESFSFWTGHPYDLEVWVRTGAAVAAGQNPYNHFWVPVPGVSFAFLFGPMPSAAYLPFWPIVTGALFRLYEAVGRNDPFVLYFLLKQPPILGDMLDGILLYRLALTWSGTPAVARRLLWVWMLFPYDIVISAIWGQFDALVATTLLAALAVRNDTGRQALYGLGIFMKWVTAIFLPYEVFRLKGTRRLLPFFGLGLALAATLLSFVVLGWGFTGIQSTSVSQTHGGGGGMNLAGVLTSGLVVYQLSAAAPWLYEWAPYLWIPVAFLAGAWAAWRARKSGPVGELEITMVIVSAFLLTRWGLYEQYMLYLFPLMLLDIYVFHPARRNLFLVLAVFCSIYLILNNVLGIWFLSPVWPQSFIIGLQLNASSGFGTFRAWALDALAVLVTVTLLQLVYLLSHPTADPRPWVLWWRARAAPPAAGVAE